MRIMRVLFRLLNRFLMVPMFRLGLGPFVGSPISGYIMVLKTIGWKTRKRRFVPVNFAIHDGSIYCLAGFGKQTHWYRNIIAQPKVEVILPGGTVAGQAEDATNSENALPILRQILKNSGFAGFLAGMNAFTISDDELKERTKPYKLIRIQPYGVGSGAYDAGGWFWVVLLAMTIIIIWLLFR